MLTNVPVNNLKHGSSPKWKVFISIIQKFINQVIDCFPRRSKCIQEMGRRNLISSETLNHLEL